MFVMVSNMFNMIQICCNVNYSGWIDSYFPCSEASVSPSDAAGLTDILSRLRHSPA